jgi:thioesterase domain-containing protein
MPQPIDFGAEYLQGRINREIVLAKHMGIIVEAAGDGALVLRAPLAPNSNHKGTAFGGSLYSLAVLTGWAWLTRDLAVRKFDAAAVIQESNMRFLLPVHGEMRASAQIPAGAEIERFHKMLSRAGRGRIRLSVQVRHGESVAALFEGVFAAAMRRKEI